MTDQLYKSAIFGEVDDCKGVSASVIFGQEALCGTGMCDVLFNEAQFFSDNNYEMDDYEIDEVDCNILDEPFSIDFIENEESIDLPKININFDS
jgi:DNA-directed RNA polymerase beta' subunit